VRFRKPLGFKYPRDGFWEDGQDEHQLGIICIDQEVKKELKFGLINRARYDMSAVTYDNLGQEEAT
jgi:hypothetical protein